MRVRALSPTGDYTFGRSQGNYLLNSPAAVGQHVLTALRLLQGEWFLDTQAGMPWAQQVLGKGTVNFYDLVIQDYVLSLQGVASIAAYDSQLDDVTRRLTVTMTINTIFSSFAPGGGVSVTVSGIFTLDQSILDGSGVLG